MTADSPVCHHSPRSPVTSSADGVKSLSSPWAQVVRGGIEPDTICTTPLSPSSSPPISAAPEQDLSDYSKGQSASPPPDNDFGEGSNGNVGLLHKKTAWKPLNGGDGEAGPVMGAFSWPDLSESKRRSLKSSSDSSKTLSYGSSVPVPISQGPVISPSPQKQATANPPVRPVRRPMKRGGGGGTGGVSAQSGFSRPPPPPPLPPPFPRFETPSGNLLPAVLDSPPVREPSYRGSNNWDARPMGGVVGSHSHAVNDHSSQHRNTSRRGNFGSRPRGDAVYHNNGYQDRNNWNASRSSNVNARDVHLPANTMGLPPYRGFIRPPPPPPGARPFIVPQHVRPFGNPMGFDIASPYLYVPALPQESFRAVPLVPHPPPPPMYFPPMDPPLPTLLVNQIDYYFRYSSSGFQCIKREGDLFLVLRMPYPIKESICDNCDDQYSSLMLKASKVVEVQGDKVRRRNDWRQWLKSSSQPDSASLATSLQNVALEDVTIDVKTPVGIVGESSKECTSDKGQ
ncbi:hypothetical protein LguiB_020207 [Lonicera macranthoides]